MLQESTMDVSVHRLWPSPDSEPDRSSGRGQPLHSRHFLLRRKHLERVSGRQRESLHTHEQISKKCFHQAGSLRTITSLKMYQKLPKGAIFIRGVPWATPSLKEYDHENTPFFFLFEDLFTNRKCSQLAMRSPFCLEITSACGGVNLAWVVIHRE